MNNNFEKLEKLGQSIWLDNISRDMLNKNELQLHIKEIGLKGITSNPTIFQKAIGSGSFYDEQIKLILTANPDASPYEIFEELAVKDIQDAADVLYPIYESTTGVDGYVSLEVSPELANDSNGTIEEARRLHNKVNRPNVMIKIPATKAGIPAIKQMISEGININVTLIFSPARYAEVVEAYISGLEDRVKRNESIKQVSSVASFFISRIDTQVDKELSSDTHKHLQGKTAIANARLVYQTAKQLFSDDRFSKLEKLGAKQQRLLWASTSTKNPDFPPTIYVDELIGNLTVNTLPPETIEAFKTNGSAESRIEKDIELARQQMDQLKEAGVSFDKVTQFLEDDGVKKFADSFSDLLQTIEKKKNLITTEGSKAQFLELPEEISSAVTKRLDSWEAEKLLSRLLQKDPTIWKSDKKDDVELSNRLGWLNLPVDMQSKIEEMETFASEIKNSFTSLLLFGMGGSSLAPEVFFYTFGNKPGYPSLSILDSTHPEVVKEAASKDSLDKTLFIVASKSGSTTETSSFFHYFYDELSKVKSNPGENFIAITDSGSSLESLAAELNFRKVFNTPADVGGRYSVFTYFGLVPASLIGIDIQQLLTKACNIAVKTKEKIAVHSSPGIVLGAAIGELALAGKDKLTFVVSPSITRFPAWIEQLVAESTGKEGTGIIPIIDESLTTPEKYGNDRAFVYLKLENDNNTDLDNKLSSLKEAGFPLITISLASIYDIGKEFYRWEVATAAAGIVLKINPFDQPNVQLAKTLASESMAAYKKEGHLPIPSPSLKADNIKYFGKVENDDLIQSVREFLAHGRKDNYVSIMAFTPYSVENDKLFNDFKHWIRDTYKFATTFGYGPRFLHSTGQLHKGDGNTGLFIQITSDPVSDIEIPGKGYSFNSLITAQALGDLKALQNTNRRVIRLHFTSDVASCLNYLLKNLKH
jgi:transaldolase / glucose-6-phosphate isomerase